MLTHHSAVEHRWICMGRESKGLFVKVRPSEKWMKWVRELVLVVSVRCGKERERHDTWMTIVLRTQRCAILSLPALELRCSRDEM